MVVAALRDLFAHYMEAWKSWVGSVHGHLHMLNSGLLFFFYSCSQ
jgi:hypothetical protein